MTIGTLPTTALSTARTEVTKQAERAREFQSRIKILKDSTPVPFDQIATRRTEILRQMSEAEAQRKSAVLVRENTKQLVQNSGETLKRLKEQYDGLRQEKKQTEQRLVALDTEFEEARRLRSEAKEKAERIEKETAQKMQETDMTSPSPDVAVPELSEDVQAWASKFVKLEKSQTIEYFTAESEKFAAIINVKTLKDEQARLRLRLPELTEQIEQIQQRGKTLTEEFNSAKSRQDDEQKTVVTAQGRIDDLKKALDTLSYGESLEPALAGYADTVSGLLVAAQNEVKEGLNAIRGEVNQAYSESYPKKVQKDFGEKRSALDKLLEAHKAIKIGLPFEDAMDALEDLSAKAQRYATEFDQFSGERLRDSARNMRRREIADTFKFTIAPEVAERLNALEPREELHVTPGKLYIYNGLFDEAVDASDPYDFTVPEHLHAPLITAAEEAYENAAESLLESLLEKQLKEQAAEEELQRLEEERQRLAGLDEVGKEDEFTTLKSGTLKSVVAQYKKKPAEEATKELLRAALRGALEEQRTPDRRRWCSILGLPYGSNKFINAATFTDGEGNTVNVHVSFFSDCFSANANGNISLMKSDSAKHSASEIMNLLFVSGVDDSSRVHSTIELEDDRGRKPHVYYKSSLTLFFNSTFKDRVEQEDPHDVSWETNAEEHARKVLKDRMKLLKERVEKWLTADGAV